MTATVHILVPHRPKGPSCIKCGSTATVELEDGPDFTCADCGAEWCDDDDGMTYEREPEIQPDR